MNDAHMGHVFYIQGIMIILALLLFSSVFSPITLNMFSYNSDVFQSNPLSAKDHHVLLLEVEPIY